MIRRLLSLLSVFGVLLLPLALSFGVSSPYWNDNPLVVSPGDRVEVVLTLQNMVGGADVVLQATISEGADIATLEGSSFYSVPFESDSVKVPVVIRIPSDVAEGSLRQVSIEFVQVGGTEEGTVQVAGAFSTTFPVQIVAPTRERSSSNNIFFWIIPFVFIFVILYLVKTRRKKTR